MPTLAIVLMILVEAALPVPRSATSSSCPTGYYASGGYCAPISSKSRPAVPRSGTSCPSGWSSSGNFCVKN